MSVRYGLLFSALLLALPLIACQDGGRTKPFFKTPYLDLSTRAGKAEYFFRNARNLEELGLLAGAAKNYCLAKENGNPKADAELARLGATCKGGVAIYTPPPPAPEPLQVPERARPRLKLLGSGSGFAVSSNAVVTNQHVIEGCRAVRLLRGSETINATAVKSDERADLAVLFTEDLVSPALSIRNRNAELGEDIVVFGFPYRRYLSSTPKLSVGVISATAGVGDDTSEYQISAPVQPGNSGGPVVGADAAVVGVTVAVLSSSVVAKETGTLPQNVNFAVKASVLREFLRAHGVEIRPVPAGATLDRRKIAKIVTEALFLVECWA